MKIVMVNIIVENVDGKREVISLNDGEIGALELLFGVMAKT